MPPLDERLSELLRAIRDRLPRRTPDWTDANQHDPGTTTLELLSYFAEELLQRAAQLPAAGRAELARLGLRLAELDRGDEPVDVRVNGERWRRVPSLSEADTDAPVFELDPERGTIRFGDGRHGRRPEDGARVTVRYREGSGTSGPEITLSATWPPGSWRRTVSSLSDGSIHFSRPAAPVTEPSEAERVSFFTGQLLTAADFQAEQDYVREKLRRLARAALGTGIVSGLTPTVSTNDSGTATLAITPGSAVDPSGELIVVSGSQTIPLDPGTRESVIQLLFAERPTRFVPSVGEDAGSGEECPSRIAEGFTIKIDRERDPRAVVLGRLTRDADGWHVVTTADDPDG